jgi:PAS domain S-box-containing protein
MKTTKGRQPGRSSKPGPLCEQRHDIFTASTADYIYGVTMHQGRWVATFHGAGCEAITGYTPAEMDVDPLLWFRMIHEEDRAPVLRHLSQLSNGEDLPPIEHRIVSKVGKVRWIRNVPVLQRDGPGGVVSYSGVISDITDRKQAKLELEHTHDELTKRDEDLTATARKLQASDEKLKSTELELIQAAKLESIGRLAAGVAHEVKNPLQTMIMGLDYLTQNLTAPHELVKGVIGDMRHAVNRASVIIHGLLELAAKTGYETEPGDLNACVLRSLGLVQYELQTTQTEVRLDLQSDLPAIPMDPLKLEQALINIFLNGVQAMPHGGPIWVTTRLEFSDLLTGKPKVEPGEAHEKVAVVEIKDSGPGIPDSDLGKVFEPFFTSKPPGSGTGLGLSIVRKIIHLHGGQIKVKNAAKGGVLVTIALPLYKEIEC